MRRRVAAAAAELQENENKLRDATATCQLLAFTVSIHYPSQLFSRGQQNTNRLGGWRTQKGFGQIEFLSRPSSRDLLMDRGYLSLAGSQHTQLPRCFMPFVRRRRACAAGRQAALRSASVMSRKQYVAICCRHMTLPRAISPSSP